MAAAARQILEESTSKGSVLWIRIAAIACETNTLFELSREQPTKLGKHQRKVGDTQRTWAPPMLLHWTTGVLLVLCVLHAVVAAHNWERESEAALRAARIAALAVVVEVCSSCDLHVVSLLIAAPTVVALVAGVGFEALHAMRYGSAHRGAQAAAREQWISTQRAMLAVAMRDLLAARTIPPAADVAPTAAPTAAFS